MHYLSSCLLTVANLLREHITILLNVRSPTILCPDPFRSLVGISPLRIRKMFIFLNKFAEKILPYRILMRILEITSREKMSYGNDDMKTFYRFLGLHTKNRCACGFPVKSAWLTLPSERSTRCLWADYMLPLGSGLSQREFLRNTILHMDCKSSLKITCS